MVLFNIYGCPAPPAQPKFQIFTPGSHYGLFFQPYFSKNCLHNNNIVLFWFFTSFSNVYAYMTSSQRNIIKKTELHSWLESHQDGQRDMLRV